MEKTFELPTGEKYRLTIEQDTDASDPRTEFDNLTKMACSHRRYTLGDKEEAIRADYFNGWDEVEKYLIEDRGAVPYLILPLYLFDHSGITISTKSFSCRWDSGQVGLVYLTRADIKKEFGYKRLTAARRERLEKLIEAEVKLYDDFLTGNVWGFTLEQWDNETEDWEKIDSCWEFYGDVSECGIFEHLPQQVAELARNEF